MHAAQLLLLLPPLLLALLAAPASPVIAPVIAGPQPQHQPPGSRSVNATRPGAAAEATVTGGGGGGGGSSNSSGDALVTRLSSLLRDLPTLKAAVIVACAFSAFLIACLLLRVFRSGKRLKKTRKYDIITTPAERVEMAPLNEEDDEDEDSTVFDIKYSYLPQAFLIMAGASLVCGLRVHFRTVVGKLQLASHMRLFGPLSVALP